MSGTDARRDQGMPIRVSFSLKWHRRKSIREPLKYILSSLLTVLLIISVTVSLSAQTKTGIDNDEDKTAELAKKLQNPVANLVSVPIQNNGDFAIGPKGAMRYTANIQPVVPFSLNNEWILVVRTIVPFIYAEEVAAGLGNTTGMGDILQSFFLSPEKPAGHGWMWGAGPVFHYPTATNDALGRTKFGAGPTAVILRQKNGWTYGLLANHIWSVAGTDSRADENATFLQPFVSYTTKTFTTFGVNSESNYDWLAKEWTIPLNVSISQLAKIGKQPIQFQVGARYYAEKPAGGPKWGLRFSITFLFPK